jgi:hypothetical protein
MARFFRSPSYLSDWISKMGSSKKAVMAVINLPGLEETSETDLNEMITRIMSGKDSENASNTLFQILAAHDIAEADADAAKEKADTIEVADDLLENKVITAEAHQEMIKEANIFRQPGLYNDMPLRICPKLPFSVGKGVISTYNCRHYCLDSMVLDDDPTKVYCLETMWRRHTMDKFAREWKDKDTGRWVGGYINDRFHCFPEAGTPDNPHVDRMQGNQMELKPGERTRQPRPHQWSVERRMQEQREPGSTESIVLAQRGQDNMIKLAATNYNNADDEMFAIFSKAIDLRSKGVSEEDAALAMSEEFGISVGSAVQIQSAALKKMSSHVSDVYSIIKGASDNSDGLTKVAFEEGVDSDAEKEYDAEQLGLTDQKPEGDLAETPSCPNCQGPGLPLGSLGNKEHFSCRDCGSSFSRG